MKSGPIIIVEDDEDDLHIFQDVLKEMEIKNSLVWFQSAMEAYDYLKNTSDQPFIIFSDVNLPGLKGTEFKKKINADPQLRKKSIPFIFYSTSDDNYIVTEAYTELTIQGFFKKKSTFEEIKNDIKLILDYWKACRHPNFF